MTSNFAARAATAGELIKFRGTKTEVFRCRINQGSFTAPVDEITYDTSTGNTTDVLPEYICYVSASAFGAKEKGVCKIRATPSGTKIYITANSLISFTDNDYLTVYTIDRNGSRLGLAIRHPQTVYTARINQATFDNQVAKITYDGGVGTLANV